MFGTQIGPFDAAARLAERRRARGSLEAWCRLALRPLGYEPARHHLLLIAELEKIARGEIDRLMVLMPPGSAKSTYASQLFPPWFMANYPRHVLIAASNTADLAEDFSRRIIGFIKEHKAVLGYDVTRENAALWDTTNGCRYRAAGVRGTITGHRSDVAIIDDPIRSAEEAANVGIREKTWEWWRQDFITRLKPGGRIVLIQCMTGDTPVRRPDGSETPLRDIRPGDEVATYRNGALSTAKVVNFVNNGPDSVFEIRTTSGIIVRANERHPFLVRVGEEMEWRRLKDLRPLDEICRVNGENGKARRASPRAVAHPLNAAVTAISTTAASVGRMAFESLRAILQTSAAVISNTATASPLKTTTASTLSKRACAPFASSLPERMSGLIGAASCAWTTATLRKGFERCSATTAIWPLDISRRRKPRSFSLTTCDFTLDRIEKITPAGSEDVFDIEVAETANFIAAGLVSHNTRWHGDDLAGRLLQTEADEWRVLSLPAFADADDDPLGRAMGEPLWPEWESGEKLKRRRRALGETAFSALYQQRPTAQEGVILKRHWWRPWTAPRPKRPELVVISLDPAMTEREQNDFSACVVFNVVAPTPMRRAEQATEKEETRPRILLRYAWEERHEFPRLIERLEETVAHFAPKGVAAHVLIEAKANGLAVAQELRRRAPELYIWEVDPKGDKVARANAVTPMLEAGVVYAMAPLDDDGEPEFRPWAQKLIDHCANFPLAAHDDLADATTQALLHIRDRGLDLFPEDDLPPVLEDVLEKPLY